MLFRMKYSKSFPQTKSKLKKRLNSEVVSFFQNIIAKTILSFHMIFIFVITDNNISSISFMFT